MHVKRYVALYYTSATSVVKTITNKSFDENWSKCKCNKGVIKGREKAKITALSVQNGRKI